MAAAAIPELTYTTALYSLDDKKGTLVSTNPPGMHTIFPRSLTHTDLAQAIAVQHAACFKTGAEEPARLVDTFSGDTIFLAICVGQTRAQYGKPFPNSIDQASATVQHADHIGEATGTALPEQYWIHEVCRFKNKEMLQQLAPTLTPGQVNEFFKQVHPIQLIMNLLESVICSQGDNKHAAAFLMVEKNPEHGSADFLLEYYSKQGYRLVKEGYDSHHFMGKSCQRIKLRKRGGYRKRKKTRKRKKRKKTRRRRKKHYRHRRQTKRRRR